MEDRHARQVAAELGIKDGQVRAVARLFEEGGTVPFIARYRKEATGSLDEVEIRAVRDRLEKLAELDSRREAIVKSLTERELLTPELEQRLVEATALAELEDIYLPYKPKRRTRGTMAKEKGLEPLALLIWEQSPDTDPEKEAAAFVDPEKGVAGAEEALAGARDIMAEWINEDQTARERLRRLFQEKSLLVSRVIEGQEEAGAKFRDYFDWSEPLAAAPSHRVLAMRRGEKEGHLTLKVAPPEEAALAILEDLFLKNGSPAGQQAAQALADSYKRLLSRSLETETRLWSKDLADLDAVKVFADNLRHLLMSPPLGQKRVLAIDPGFRTGCKVVCLDAQGGLLAHGVINIMTDRQKAEAASLLLRLIREHGLEAVAIGNGTAGRETESLVRSLALPPQVMVAVVSEAGASVYSASEVAREELGQVDLTVRGSVSIGRRLMDPLAELVKIDPKSIGVGQYQHDVDQKLLKESLDDVVISCVNAVGVEVNTASPQLLSHVSGLGPSLAKAIVDYRSQNGPFLSRRDLTRVPRLGPKAFEQSAGFLRVSGGPEPLDASAVHPESYAVVEAMAADLGRRVGDLVGNRELVDRIDLKRYVGDTVGLPTLEDIRAELLRPGRDPREEFEAFSFQEGVEKIQDLVPGMKLPGIVTNVTNFGAFVDVGVHVDGLVHISELADRFVRDPAEVVKVQDKVRVTVLEVDLPRQRISLSMKSVPGSRPAGARPEAEGGGRAPGGPRPGGKGGKPPRAKQEKPREEKSPFNNPFAQALSKIKK